MVVTGDIQLARHNQKCGSKHEPSVKECDTKTAYVLTGGYFFLVSLGLYTAKVFYWPHILRTWQVWRTVFSVQLASSLTYIRSAAVVNLRIVAHPLEIGSKSGSIVIKRDSLMHRD
jgi:hypothetical protein